MSSATFELDAQDLDLLITALDYKLTDPDMCEDCQSGYEIMLEGFMLAIYELGADEEEIELIRRHGEA